MARGRGFEVRFFSPERRLLVPEVLRVVVCFTPAGRKTGSESHLPEPPGDGKALWLAPTVRPPHGFRFTVLLFAADAERPLKVHTADFRADGN